MSAAGSASTLDIRAKERLTGAVIVVAVIVVLVPELLPGPIPPRSSSHTELSSLRQVAGHLLDELRGAPPAQTRHGSLSAQSGTIVRPAVQPEAVPVADLPAQPHTGRLPPPAPAPVTAASSPPAAASSSPAVSPAGAAGREPSSAVAATGGPGSGELTDAAQPGARASGHWTVQVGAFASLDHAERAVQQLAEQGFRTAVSPVTVAGQTRYRVRAEPAGSHLAMERLVRRLRRAGHKGRVVPE